MTFQSKQLTWRGSMLSVCSLCLMVLGNDYLNAIYNLFTMPEREGSGVKTIWRWSEPRSAAEAGDTSEGREVRPGRFD